MLAEEEIIRMCLEVRAVRDLLLKVTGLKSLSVGPLYNVWDSLFEPSNDLVPQSGASQLPWLPQERKVKGMVKVPWRGG